MRTLIRGLYDGLRIVAQDRSDIAFVLAIGTVALAKWLGLI